MAISPYTFAVIFWAHFWAAVFCGKLGQWLNLTSKFWEIDLNNQVPGIRIFSGIDYPALERLLKLKHNFWFDFSEECLSNDPPNKENPYKSFYTQVIKCSKKVATLYTENIVKILNLYIMLSCIHLHHFLPVSVHYLQCIHCLLHYMWRNI